MATIHIVTTLTYDELGELIKNKKVSLNNGKLLFGHDTDTINHYFQERIGNQGYVIGLRGRINKMTADLFKQLDDGVMAGNTAILEAEVNEDDMLRYTIDGVGMAADALTYGLSEGAIYEELDRAQKVMEPPAGAEVLCVPYIQANGKIRVTSLVEDLSFNVDGIAFVKL